MSTGTEREGKTVMAEEYANIDPEIARQALLTQGACNAGGLIHSLHRAVERLQEQMHAEGHGTDWLNRHPVLVLYLTQLADLSGAGALERWREAVAACEQASGTKLA